MMAAIARMSHEVLMYENFWMPFACSYGLPYTSNMPLQISSIYPTHPVKQGKEMSCHQASAKGRSQLTHLPEMCTSRIYKLL